MADRISCADKRQGDWLAELIPGQCRESGIWPDDWQAQSWQFALTSDGQATAAFVAARAAASTITTDSLRTRHFTTGRRRREKDGVPALLLAHHCGAVWQESTNDGRTRQRLLNVVEPAEQQTVLPEVEVDATDVLVLAGPDKQTVTALYIRADPARRAIILALAERLMQPDQKRCQLGVTLGRHPAVTEMWVVDAGGRMADAMTALANELLDLLLTAHRPVAAWRAHYFIPVQLREGWQAEWPDLAPPPKQDEKNYFLDEANRLIGSEHPVWESRSREIAPDSGPDITLLSPLHHEPLTAKVSGLALHRTESKGQTALLEWQCGVDQPQPTQPILWQRYLDEAQSAADLWSLAQWLDFHAEARFIKHHYLHEVLIDGQFTPVSLTLAGAPLVFDDRRQGQAETTMVDLLTQAFGLQSVSPVADNRDRAHAMASIVLDGGVCRDGAIDPLLASLACVDPYAPGGFYDDQFAEQEYEVSQYRRFWNRGTYFLATSHSFAMLGFRQDEDAIRAMRASYVERKIHAEHMPTMYRRLYMLGLFQQLALDDVGRQLSLRADWTHHEDDLRDLRRQWIDLRAARWFTRVSSELQGEELYAHIRKAQQVDEDAALLDRKLTELEQVYSLRHDKLEKRRDHFLELVALPIVIFIAIREMMYTGDSEYPEALTHWFEGLMRWAEFENPFLSLTLVSFVLALILWIVLNDAFRHPIVALKALKGWVFFPICMVVAIPLLIWAARVTPPFERHSEAPDGVEQSAPH